MPRTLLEGRRPAQRVRIRNGVRGKDRGDNFSEAGWVELNVELDPDDPNASNLYPFKDSNGEITTYLHPKYNVDAPRYDPDITVVAPLNPVMPIPEPGAVIALCKRTRGLPTVLLVGKASAACRLTTESRDASDPVSTRALFN